MPSIRIYILKLLLTLELEAECPIPRNLKSGVVVVLKQSAFCRPQIELKLPIRVGVVSHPARAAARYRMRDNEGFRPELRGTCSRSRRDLAICAFNASNANGAAPCRPQIELKLPIQVGVVSRRARVWARHRVRAKRRSLGDIGPHLPVLAEI